MKPILIVIICVGLFPCFAPALADAWKDESGKGWRDYDRGDWSESYERGERRHVEIPHGHSPPPGECRAWYRDLAAGHQPPPEAC